MKLKSTPLGNRVMLLLIILTANACQTDESGAKSPSDQELLSSTAVADAMSFYKKNGGSLPAMSDFMNSRYGIDFNAGYKMLMPYLNPTRGDKVATPVSEVGVGAVDEILSNGCRQIISDLRISSKRVRSF